MDGVSTKERQRWVRAADYQLRDRLWYYKGTRIFLPDACGDIKMWAMKAAHDDPQSGHRGYTPTYETLRERYFWFYDRAKVKEYVESFQTCAQQKSRVGLPLGSVHPFETPAGLVSSVSIDWLSMPATAEYVCRMSKLVKLVPCRATDTAREQASLFWRHWVLDGRGFPAEVVSDRDPPTGQQFFGSRVELERMFIEGVSPLL